MSQNKISDLILDPGLRASSGPSLDQRKASMPARHVWVRASAGSGKTKVLIDRLLRLLLPDPDTGAPGVMPDKILCLTFTKAGAAEMSLRLQKRLLEWSALETDELNLKLYDLISRDPPEEFTREARRLLARVLDAPSRLRILTIHSFCQSVLGRFPVETGLSPDFKVVEESEAGEYLKRALHDVLALSLDAPEGDLAQAFSRLAIVKNMDQLQYELQKLVGEPIKLQEFTKGLTSLGQIRAKLAKAFNLPDLDCLSDEGFCREEEIPRASLLAMAAILQQSSPKDVERADLILNWLSAGSEERLRSLGRYRKAIIAAPMGKAARTDSDYLERQAKEIERIENCYLAANISATADLLFLASYILSAYERHKKFMGVMDYNDLIFNTRRLLAGEFWTTAPDDDIRRQSTEWVLYKLDEGIDHMLVDESQDTNPDQWDIVRRLSEEYFSGSARPSDRTRTLFVVGDEKQSIFSFQRADPAEFHRMRDYFATKVAPLQEGFEESLIFSFRSTAPVLKLTDATFDNPLLLHHIGIKDGSALRHISHRSDNQKQLHGSVELWPLVIEEKKDDSGTGWKLPLSGDRPSPSAAERLARQIAMRLRGMIERGEALPGDIMILMRTRSPLMLHIIRELKNADLPISGLDRLVLSESLIIQDLLSICDFVLLPENDFALACLLKSPFVGLTEDQLMNLCLARPRSLTLWDHLRANDSHQSLIDWLDRLMVYARHVQPYEFLDEILTKPCPADPEGSGYRACQQRLGEDSLEPLDEILGDALKMELQDIRTLQEFTTHQRNTQREVKREMDEAAGQIRIMTVHASKGLEAPIVILPDTTSLPERRRLDQFLWPDKSGLPAPLWHQGGEDSAKHKAALDRNYELQLEEYSRLLYVAMTRARDRLIICGASKSETVKENCWYSLLHSGFARLETKEENGIKIFSLTETQPARQKKSAGKISALPDWIRKPAPPENEAPIAFTPSSEGSSGDEAIYSPLDASRENRFRRGLVTHKLLQILPDLHPDRREKAARAFLTRQNLSDELQQSILSETMAILNDPVFAPVFGPGSLAEVPVTGEVSPGRLINGQIDRLVITDTEILIVDFKSNRPSPKTISDIPGSYKAQLKAYAAALQAIYPGRTIKCALLWTDQPLLMPVIL